MQDNAPIAPGVVHLDMENHVLVQRFIDGSDWKQALLHGGIHVATARAAGEILSGIHRGDPLPYSAGESYDGSHRLRQLRLDPYFVHAATAVPDQATRLFDVIDYLDATQQSVVHGDFSPKNILVDPDSASRVHVIDWEVVHAGAPEFDLAFLVTHLRAKALFMPEHADALSRLEDEFLAAYTLPFDEAWFRSILGALHIARAYGRSPLDYLGKAERKTLGDSGARMLAGRR